MRLSLLIYAIIILLISCKSHLPDKYGVYVYHADSVTEISPNRTYKFNDWFDICSIEKPGSSFNKIDSVIIYFENKNIDSIRLTQLKYLSGISVEGITHQRKWADVELWQAEKDIPTEILSIKQKKGMYIIKPQKELTAGVYAIHFGIMWNCNVKKDSVLNKVYDFRIIDGLH